MRNFINLTLINLMYNEDLRICFSLIHDMWQFTGQLPDPKYSQIKVESYV